MNKKGLIISIIIIILIIGGFSYYIYINSQNNDKNNQYEAERTSTNSEVNDNNSSVENNTIQKEISKGITSEEDESKEEPKTQPVETQLSTFSTKIYSNDSARQNNIEITCNTLNNTIVKNGDTFSFCGTVGQSSTSKGYQKADIFDKNGKKKKGLGGGNCQISSTLYNAVLAVPTLVITERHEHSNYVPYVEKGKDAAVAYGSYDFQFRNNSGNDIKINASTDGQNVTTSLISIN